MGLYRHRTNLVWNNPIEINNGVNQFSLVKSLFSFNGPKLVYLGENLKLTKKGIYKITTAKLSEELDYSRLIVINSKLSKPKYLVMIINFKYTESSLAVAKTLSNYSMKDLGFIREVDETVNHYLKCVQSSDPQMNDQNVKVIQDEIQNRVIRVARVYKIDALKVSFNNFK